MGWLSANAWRAASQNRGIVLLSCVYGGISRLMFSFPRWTLVAVLLLISLQLVSGDETKTPAVPPELAAADQLYRAGKFVDAEASYRTLLRTDSKLVPAQVGLVRTMLRQQLSLIHI